MQNAHILMAAIALSVCGSVAAQDQLICYGRPLSVVAAELQRDPHVQGIRSTQETSCRFYGKTERCLRQEWFAQVDERTPSLRAWYYPSADVEWQLAYIEICEATACQRIGDVKPCSFALQLFGEVQPRANSDRALALKSILSCGKPLDAVSSQLSRLLETSEIPPLIHGGGVYYAGGAGRGDVQRWDLSQGERLELTYATKDGAQLLVSASFLPAEGMSYYFGTFKDSCVLERTKPQVARRPPATLQQKRLAVVAAFGRGCYKRESRAICDCRARLLLSEVGAADLRILLDAGPLAAEKHEWNFENDDVCRSGIAR